MQMLRTLYTNEVIRLMVTIALLCLDFAATAAVVRLLNKKISLLRWITFSLTFTVMGYIASSAALFTVNWFGVRKALLLQLVLTGCIALGVVLRGKKRGTLSWGELDTDLRPHLIPLFLVAVGLVVSWGNFGYFGMGQDQGVYQVKALNLMNGVTDRVYSFTEYEKLETEDQKQAFYSSLLKKQLGLDLIDDTPEENRVLAALRTGGNGEHEHTDGIFHGIPTYPALLALWGTVFGVGNMSGVQTLLYLLAMLTLWFTAENLGLKKGASALVCLLFMLSPEVVWISKSTLTEELLALIICRFAFDLTRSDQPERRWWSAWMVLMFALVHVSIFVLIPLFFLLYILLYLWTEDPQYARALRISALSFMGGYTFMVLAAPRYTIRNTAMIWVGPVTLANVYWIFMAVGLVGILLSFLLRKIPVRDRFRAFAGGKGGAWTLRVLIVLLLGACVLLSLRKLGANGLEQTVSTNGLYGMCWMTGLIFLPVALVSLIRKPRTLLKDEAVFGLAVLFGYAVLFMCCVLKVDIAYCYYYGRYLTPYVPVACIVVGLVWNRYSGRAVGAGLAAGVLVCAPFDSAMLWRQDDTFSTFDTFSRVVESVSVPDSAVIFQDRDDPESVLRYSPMFLIPVKTLTGNECYFAEEDVDSQAARLSSAYRKVYCITPLEKDWKLVTQITDSVFMDDNHSYRLPFCPFPLSFSRGTHRYYVYQYEGHRVFTADELYASVPKEGNAVVLPKGQIQYGPYVHLPPGSYEVRFSGRNLSGADCYPTVDNGVLMEYECVSQSDTEAVIRFSSAVDLDNLEFITRNLQEEPVTVERITLVFLTDP